MEQKISNKATLFYLEQDKNMRAKFLLSVKDKKYIGVECHNFYFCLRANDLKHFQNKLLRNINFDTKVYQKVRVTYDEKLFLSDVIDDYISFNNVENSTLSIKPLFIGDKIIFEIIQDYDESAILVKFDIEKSDLIDLYNFINNVRVNMFIENRENKSLKGEDTI